MKPLQNQLKTKTSRIEAKDFYDLDNLEKQQILQNICRQRKIPFALQTLELQRYIYRERERERRIKVHY